MADNPPDRLPLVSVITPTLQRANYLEQTLLSVRAQTYPNVEHIVVDGGSTDGTLELLERYAGTYNLRWISEPDRGMYDAVNKGLRMAHGETLAYVNSDDLYFPWTVSVVVDALASHAGADLVFGDAVRVDEDRGWAVPVFMPQFRTGPMAAYAALLQPCVFMRRRVFEALGGFDAHLAYVADMDLWLRAATTCRFVHVREFVALERRHAGMLSETRRLEMAAENAKMRRLYRTGLGATRAAAVAGRAWWHWSSGRAWWAFVRAAREAGSGWPEGISALGPQVDARTAVAGLIPSRASRNRRMIRWGRDPLAAAMALEQPPRDRRP